VLAERVQGRAVRDRGALEKLRAELGRSFTAVPAYAADPTVAGQLIDAYRPAILALNAGAHPLPRPIQRHTWQTFSKNWDVGGGCLPAEEASERFGDLGGYFFGHEVAAVEGGVFQYGAQACQLRANAGPRSCCKTVTGIVSWFPARRSASPCSTSMDAEAR